MDLSIIIPAYNEEKYIEKTLQAIKGAEVIVVCNGCTDKTEEIARRYANKVIVLEKKGVSYARNHGAKAALHSRLVFLDADIVVDENVLEKVSQSPYTIGTCLVRADSSSFLDKVMMKVKSQIHRFGFCTGLIFCDRNIFEKAGGFEETLTKKEDGRFLRRAKKIGNYGVVQGYVINNLRRFRARGYISEMWYWMKEYILPSKKEYESVR